MWFLIAFSFDCGTGWIAAMISIIGYSTFCCCQPNDAGLKCMLQTVIVSGVFRFISFCMLCAYLGNINDWDHSCVLAKTDCYNNGITYSDGLTNCHHHKSGCGKNKDDDAYCPNTLGLYSAKFEIYQYGGWENEADHNTFDPYVAAVDKADCSSYAKKYLTSWQKQRNGSATSVLVYTILLALGQIIICARCLKLLKNGGTLQETGDAMGIVISDGSWGPPPHGMGAQAFAVPSGQGRGAAAYGQSAYVPTVQGHAVQGVVVQGHVVQGHVMPPGAGGGAAAQEPEHATLPSAKPVGVDMA
jgi:hypothetical protein